MLKICLYKAVYHQRPVETFMEPRIKEKEKGKEKEKERKRERERERERKRKKKGKRKGIWLIMM